MVYRINMKNLVQHIQEKLQISRNKKPTYEYSWEGLLSNKYWEEYKIAYIRDIADKPVKILDNLNNPDEIIGINVLSFRLIHFNRVGLDNTLCVDFDSRYNNGSITINNENRFIELLSEDILQMLYDYICDTVKSNIHERLQISRSKKSVYTLFPKDEEELRKIVDTEVKKNGAHCSLNHIDISQLTSLSKVFLYSDFDGDISQWDTSNITDMSATFAWSDYTGKYGSINDWDVSNVTRMEYTFQGSRYKGELSNWDTSNVETMQGAFYDSLYDGDISSWDVSKVKNTKNMFLRSDYTGKNGSLDNWDVSNVTDAKRMFSGSKYTGDLNNWNINPKCNTELMFEKSVLEDNKMLPVWYKE